MSSSSVIHPCHTVSEPTEYAGVEPLVLPEPGVAPVPCPHAAAPRSPTCDQSLDTDLRLLRRCATSDGPGGLHAPDDPDAHARYRWMVGHHAAFGVWQCLRRALERATLEPGAPQTAIRTAAWLYDVYSVLFLYTGSCSARRYEATIRPDMTECHPAFSGEWARDYEEIPTLLRRVRARYPADVTAPLTEAARRNGRVHMAVASKLVPRSSSLLQEAGRQPGTHASPTERDLYDAYFAVHRRQVCRPAFTAQLVRRLTQILCDIEARPLADVNSPPPTIDGPHLDAVRTLHSRAAFLLRKTAEDLVAETRTAMAEQHNGDAGTPPEWSPHPGKDE